MAFPTLGLDHLNKVYDIKPKPKGELPFDFRGDGTIDLIVSKVNKNAYDLLDDFDLTICKACWNGKNFKIPNPHETFCAKSTYDSKRCAVVNSYMTHYSPPNTQNARDWSQETYAASKNAFDVIERVQKDVPRAPFYNYIDMAKDLRESYDPNADVYDWRSSGTFTDSMVQAKYGASIQFHNWTCKLVHRLQKYQKRGIKVIGAPIVREDIKEIEMMPF